jgi:iron complex outermembrane recepter protein
MRKSVWLLSAGLFALATPAFAQDASKPATDTDQQGAQPTDGATAEGAAVANQANEPQSVDTSDIVITATRRNEALSDVPLAVSAVTAERLAYTGASDIRQLNQVSPSLLVSSTSSEAGAGVARIRGVGTVGDNPGLESSVGVFIDGVYRNRTGMGLTELGPLDRIEVLRGPQGTLFGRNTSAGLISIITAKPQFQTIFSGEATIGNYDLRRLEATATGPISESLAVRLDGVWMQRDGFLEDVVSGRDVNDRDRWLLRGQVLYQPSENLSVRIVGDVTKRREECCAATYLHAHDSFRAPGGTVEEGPSTIAAIERALGGIILDDTFDRKVSITPGRNYTSNVNDWGLSGEVNYDFGGAELTSITAYRYNKYTRGQDADFNNLDILFRDDDGSSFNRFKTFTQELRLQGKTFGGRLDWLVGGYYANEKLGVDDNLTYGADYSRYANCLVGANFASAPGVPPSILAPGVSPTCFNTPVATGVRTALVGSYNTALAGALAAQAAGNAALAAQLFTAAANVGSQITALGAFAGLDNTALAPGLPSVNFGGAPFGNSGFTNLAIALGGPSLIGSTLNGAGLDDSYRQSSSNWALFTHNIFTIFDGLDLTVGARYTHEKKKLDVDLLDNNTLCTVLSGSSLQQLPCVIPSAPGGSLSFDDSRTENKLSGTVVLSYKITPEILTYASYSRGYKGGGFNLDRSALWRAQPIPTTVPATPGTTVLSNPPLSGSGAICVSPLQKGCQGIVASGADLQFKEETNDAFELGLKYNGRGIDVNVALFRQLFDNFQLNTFNGLNFVVENINSCSKDLDGADVDNSGTTGACTGKTRAGVKSLGAELEVFTRPLKDVSMNFGLVYADTRYRHNLVGAGGRPLTNALFQLPGRNISNAAEWTATSSVAWTPRIGSSGIRGLIYADVRYMSDYNTGSDLDIEKTQGGYTLVNGRIGLHGPDDMWGIELWAQNLLDKNYIQVGFDAPIQGSGTARGVASGFYPRSTQLYGAFLGEPRTYGLTLKGKFGPRHAAPEPYVAPPAPPPPAPAPVVEQPAPPPPPPPTPERG